MHYISLITGNRSSVLPACSGSSMPVKLLRQDEILTVSKLQIKLLYLPWRENQKS